MASPFPASLLDTASSMNAELRPSTQSVPPPASPSSARERRAPRQVQRRKSLMNASRDLKDRVLSKGSGRQLTMADAGAVPSESIQRVLYGNLLEVSDLTPAPAAVGQQAGGGTAVGAAALPRDGGGERAAGGGLRGGMRPPLRGSSVPSAGGGTALPSGSSVGGGDAARASRDPARQLAKSSSYNSYGTMTRSDAGPSSSHDAAGSVLPHRLARTASSQRGGLRSSPVDSDDDEFLASDSVPLSRLSIAGGAGIGLPAASRTALQSADVKLMLQCSMTAAELLGSQPVAMGAMLDQISRSFRDAATAREALQKPTRRGYLRMYSTKDSAQHAKFGFRRKRRGSVQEVEVAKTFYFVLSGLQVAYFKTASDVAVRGSLTLESSCEIKLDRDPRVIVILRPDDSQIWLMAASSAEAVEWLLALTMNLCLAAAVAGGASFDEGERTAALRRSINLDAAAAQPSSSTHNNTAHRAFGQEAFALCAEVWGEIPLAKDGEMGWQGLETSELHLLVLSQVSRNGQPAAEWTRVLRTETCAPRMASARWHATAFSVMPTVDRGGEGPGIVRHLRFQLFSSPDVREKTLVGEVVVSLPDILAEQNQTIQIPVTPSSLYDPADSVYGTTSLLLRLTAHAQAADALPNGGSMVGVAAHSFYVPVAQRRKHAVAPRSRTVLLREGGTTGDLASAKPQDVDRVGAICTERLLLPRCSFEVPAKFLSHRIAKYRSQVFAQSRALGVNLGAAEPADAPQDEGVFLGEHEVRAQARCCLRLPAGCSAALGVPLCALPASPATAADAVPFCCSQKNVVTAAQVEHFVQVSKLVLRVQALTGLLPHYEQCRELYASAVQGQPSAGDTGLSVGARNVLFSTPSLPCL